MTNYEIIKKYIAHGFWAVVKTNSKKYMIYISITSGWPIRRSFDEWKITECMNTLWIVYDSEIEINELEIESITPIYPPFKAYKEWDLVDVLETVKNLTNYDLWDNEYKIAGKKWIKILWIIQNWTYRLIQDDNSYEYPHHVLAPHIEEISTIEIGGLKYNVKDVADRLKGLDPIQANSIIESKLEEEELL